MATNWVNIKGRVKWAQVYDPDEYAGDKRWKVTFYPFDGAEWEKFRAAGFQLEPKADSEGNEFIVLRRPCKRTFNDEVVFFTPPVISGEVEVYYALQGTTEKITNYRKGDVIVPIGEQKPIGNDSIVVANICRYDTVQGKGHRLEGLKVLEHVEYEREESKEESKEEPKEEPKKKAKSTGADNDTAW